MHNSRVILGTYNHMPEGATEASFEVRYQSCWRPFLSVLYRFPEVSALLHYSGSVLAWLELRHPEFLMLLDDMLQRKQVELLGGGYFSPLLSLLPPSDRLGQIELLTTAIRRMFGKRPMGGWLHEYNWEPGFASLLQSCGFAYAFLPESHFRRTGSDLLRTGRPVITEDQGKTINIFPVSDMDEIGYGPHTFETAFELLRAARPEASLHTIMADGALTDLMWKKAGYESPDIMYETSFAWFKKYQLEIETTTPAKYMKTQRRSEVGFFPSGASKQLMRAARGGPPDSDAPFFGSPRSLVIRSSNVRMLYSKMQYVHLLVGQLRGDKSRKKSAQEELWKGQCGAAYWDAPCDRGLSLRARAAAYASLLEAEKTTRQRGAFAAGLIQTDVDFDGERELLYQGTDLNCYVQLKGASAFELDSFRTRHNYIDCQDLAGSPHRAAFLDRVYAHGSFSDLAADFGGMSYQLRESDKPAHMAVFARECHIAALPPPGSEQGPDRSCTITLRKVYLFGKDSVHVEFELRNLESTPIAFRFATVLNLSASTQADFGFGVLRQRDRIAGLAAGRGVHDQVDGFYLEPAHARESLVVRASAPISLEHDHRFAEEASATDSGGQAGWYLGSAFVCGWDVVLPPDGAERRSLTLELSS